MKARHAFTLIELLIVVAIIGILAAIAVPNFVNAQIKAKIGRTHADMQTVITALEMYFVDWNSYTEDHDYPTDPTQRGFYRLTSPVAYLNSLPIDVFPGNRINETRERDRTFEFGSGFAGRPGVQWPATAYLLMSPGPNMLEEAEANDDFPFGTRIFTYDISNGIKSRGDIIRMGGQWTRGVIQVDGRYVVGGPRG